MKEQKIYKLIDKVLTGQASAEEISEVDVWYESFENRAGITDTLKAEALQKAVQTSFTAVKAAVIKG